jgi:D-amino-acid oxidase
MLTVVGAGVSGLTCALALRRAGFDARIVTADLPSETTSMVAAAVWTVPGSEAGNRNFQWAQRSRDVFASLATNLTTGVDSLRQLELEVTPHPPLGWEADWIRPITPSELPSGYAGGWMIDGYRIDPRVYLAWLRGEFERLGGHLAVGRLERLEEAEGLVVNCTGLESRELCDDPEVVPIRGQVLVVSSPGIDEGVSDENDPDHITYVYPRRDQVILGGTRQIGDWNMKPDAATNARILADCLRLDPRLAGCKVLESRVGLRPGRKAVRLEPGRMRDARPVIHNYGHGGMGYILSWGCADEVVALAGSILGGDDEPVRQPGPRTTNQEEWS